MSREAPLISKTLTLVSFAIIVVIAALALSAAYSGYEEYGAITAAVNSSTSTSANNNNDQLTARINGSQITISGFDIPNKMVYPLKLELVGNMSLSGISLGNFDSGPKVIQPGQTEDLGASTELNFSELMQDSSALKTVLFNSTSLVVNSTIAATMVPLVGINLTKSAMAPVGPMLGGLSFDMETNQSEMEQNGASILVPIVLSWNNESPLSFSGLEFNATIFQLPSSNATGNFGLASGPLQITPGANSETYYLQFPMSDFSSNGKLSTPPNGDYSIMITLSPSGSPSEAVSFTETVTA